QVELTTHRGLEAPAHLVLLPVRSLLVVQHGPDFQKGAELTQIEVALAMMTFAARKGERIVHLRDECDSICLQQPCERQLGQATAIAARGGIPTPRAPRGLLAQFLHETEFARCE